MVVIRRQHRLLSICRTAIGSYSNEARQLAILRHSKIDSVQQHQSHPDRVFAGQLHGSLAHFEMEIMLYLVFRDVDPRLSISHPTLGAVRWTFYYFHDGYDLIV